MHILKIQVSLKDHTKGLLEETTQTCLYSLSRQLTFIDLTKLNG